MTIWIIKISFKMTKWRKKPQTTKIRKERDKKFTLPGIRHVRMELLPGFKNEST